MRKNEWKYLIFALSLLTLLAVFFMSLDGLAKTQIKDDSSYFRNTEHDYQKFLDRVFYAIQYDVKGRMPKRIYFIYGEKLNRELELKSASVYWMREK